MKTNKMKTTPPPHRDREGARYEKCRECGLEWNVSKQQEIPPSGYLCPRCWSRQKQKGAKHERNF